MGQSFKCLVHLVIQSLADWYKNSVLIKAKEFYNKKRPSEGWKKVKEFYNKKWPSKGWSGVHLLHHNASSLKCEVVKSLLASEKVEVLNHAHYSPDLSPCDFFLFPNLRKCFLEISIRIEVLLAALFIRISNRYQKKTIYLLLATG